VGSLDQLWAGWRSEYIASMVSGDEPTVAQGEGSLFERILGSGLSDEAAYIVYRGPICSALLNAYPYTNGHLLVLPNRAVAELEELTAEELSALGAAVRDAVVTLKTAYACEGVNVGMNLGRAAGAGVPDHLHAHVLPRWNGDTNFMTSVADTRVMPESLASSWVKLRRAWPAAQ
jgi:ATP adenylyltransferase